MNARLFTLSLVFLGLLPTACVTVPTTDSGGAGSSVSAESGKAVAAMPAAQKPVLENLLRAELEGAKGKEVVVSRVEIPPHSSLPKHWHPGEEFGYVIDGSVTLWQKGKKDVLCRKGDAVKIPLKQIHAAITGEEGASLLVFRVHEMGQPERVVVE